ncbi:MAG: isoprenylcysteine carboxylmethyltransferase family protein [Blautia sp.]|nr:isoprenylcysteine carboxylmethyltransferase family protein [Lachnoclostridium sp.]MCM1210157.1 isoprenylcysteine carboxylmethyltransferase family protein [Blautia sp.]
MMFQIITVLMMLAFYGCYFTKMISQKKKGIQTDQMGKGKKGFPKLIEIVVKKTAIAVFITEAISIYFNTSYLPRWARYIGIVLAALGDILFICSIFTMRDSWRAGVPADKTELVTEGIYQISRNPAFLGFDLVYIGVAMVFFNPILCAVSAFAVLMFHLQIVNVEEDFLIATFGERYLEYQRRVNRYFGRRLSGKRQVF